MDDFEFPPIDTAPPAEKPQFEDDVFKKWFKTGSKSGFLAVRTWLDAGKVSIDIGETTNNGVQNTQVWTNAIQLVTYLGAVYQGRGAVLYPQNRQAPTPESYVYYGGGTQDGKPISRILKIHHWQTGTGDNAKFDESAFVWKCGHFAAKKADSGAFIPDMSKMLSNNLIKVTRAEMAEMYYRLDLAIKAFANREPNLFQALNGNKR